MFYQKFTKTLCKFFLKLLRPIGYFFELIKSSKTELHNLSNSKSNILPSKKQAERLLNEKINKKAYMINLLELKEMAQYKDKPFRLLERKHMLRNMERRLLKV